MSFLIATPCYGRMLTQSYFESSLRLCYELERKGIPHDWLMTGNESLITRARDTSAAEFLKSEFERLLFIDADIEYKVSDVIRLWNLDADIAVGAYRVKKVDSHLTVWKDGKLTDLDQFTEPMEVDFAGTGFMMVKRAVFEKLKETVPEYIEGQKGGQCWGFFQDPIKSMVHLSEDYFFCETARENGFKVICDPKIRLKHWGSYAYE